MTENSPTPDVRERKDAFLKAFYVNLLFNFCVYMPWRLTSDRGVPPSLLGALIGLAGVALGLWALYSLFRFASALDYGWLAWPMALFSFIPIVYLIVLFRLIAKYKERTGAELTFLMFDKQAP